MPGEMQPSSHLIEGRFFDCAQGGDCFTEFTLSYEVIAMAGRLFVIVLEASGSTAELRRDSGNREGIRAVGPPDSRSHYGKLNLNV